MRKLIISVVLSLICLNLYAQNAQDLFKEGTALIKNGKYDLAVAKLQEALKSNPDDIGAACNLAVAYAYNGQDDLAIAEIEKAIYKEPSPSRAILFYNLGNLYMRKGDEKEAENNYSNSIYLMPNFAQPYVQLGLLYVKRGESQEAEKNFSLANSIDSFMPDISPAPLSGTKRESVGFIQMKFVDKDSAPALYLYHSPAWYLSLAINDIRNQQFNEARMEVEKAIQALDKDSPLEADKFALVEVHSYMGNSYLLEKEYDLALKEYQLGYEVNPRHVGILTCLGTVYLLMGNYAESSKYCKIALEIDPKFPPALFLKEQLALKGK